MFELHKLENFTEIDNFVKLNLYKFAQAYYGLIVEADIATDDSILKETVDRMDFENEYSLATKQECLNELILFHVFDFYFDSCHKAKKCLNQIKSRSKPDDPYED